MAAINRHQLSELTCCSDSPLIKRPKTSFISRKFPFFFKKLFFLKIFPRHTVGNLNKFKKLIFDLII